MNRCPDSATCKATPVNGRCPFHAEHAQDAEAYAEAERHIAHDWSNR